MKSDKPWMDCGTAVAEVMRKYIENAGSPAERMQAAMSGATIAIASFTGSYTGAMGLPFDEASLDEVWASLLRPMALAVIGIGGPDRVDELLGALDRMAARIRATEQ